MCHLYIYYKMIVTLYKCAKHVIFMVWVFFKSPYHVWEDCDDWNMILLTVEMVVYIDKKKRGQKSSTNWSVVVFTCRLVAEWNHVGRMCRVRWRWGGGCAGATTRRSWPPPSGPTWRRTPIFAFPVRYLHAKLMSFVLAKKPFYLWCGSGSLKLGWQYR